MRNLPRRCSPHRTRSPQRRRLRGGELLEQRCLLAADVVINELHVDPADKTQPLEFVELFNAGDSAADLADWQFVDGIQYTFPPATMLPAGEYLVLAEDPASLQARYGVTALGPFEGNLSNEGEKLELVDAAGTEQDQVDYGRSFPWPIVGDDRDFSMELLSPTLDNDLGGSWRASVGTPVESSELFAEGATWGYHEGTSEPSTPSSAWRQTGFDDTSWPAGPAALGYGEGFIATPLNMQGNYTSLYLRKEFTIADPSEVNELLLEAQYDDGLIVWINGTPVVDVNTPGIEVPRTATANSAIENTSFVPFTLNNPSAYLTTGTNVIAVQLLNASLGGSSDAFFDAKLTARSGSTSGVTPGAANSVLATHAGPQLRQVDQSPQQPHSGEQVTITLKATDPAGVASVMLEYQLVEPGDYIEISDPRYQTGWSNLALRDDGLAGDASANDDIYTVVLPASLQVHRRLVRYRFTATDSLGSATIAPYANDPQPNFAYFTYDTVPDWTGQATPSDPNVTYSGELLESVQTYHLLTTKKSHEESQSIPDSTAGQYRGSDYLWEGTLVYEGEVYDHIRFRARGGGWRYAMGKNMWKFDFNRGHYFQGEDNFDDEYDTTWDKLNFSAIIQQANFMHRGEQGLFESVGFKLFDLAGVEAPNTNYVQFRLITEANENGTDQFSSDFQGLYLAVEQLDGRFLDEHGLPDGNLYKMESFTGSLNNQGPTQPSDKSDLNQFLDTYNNTTPTDQWWRDNLDLESYYSYRSIVEGIHQYDIGAGKNYFYYHNPETGKWEVLPWDLDLTWANNMFGNGNEPFKSRVLNRSVFEVGYQNRLRELRDLLYNPEQTGMLIDAMAAHVYQPGEASLVDADRAMWDYNPILTSNYVNPGKAGHGRYYESSATDDFAGMIELMKDYVDSRGAWIDSMLLDNEASIPTTPSLSYTGPGSYPIDRLDFQTVPFQSPSGAEFEAIEWRIAEVTDPGAVDFDPYDRAKERVYEITSTWESGRLTTFDDSITIAGGELEAGDTYRVRVRMQDEAGRWSHWSQPTTFVAGAAVGPLVNGLRVTELHYNPLDPTAAELASQSAGDAPFEAGDFEYVELQNTASVTIDLGSVRFDDGITFDFSTSGVTTLAPGEHVLIVSNLAAFEARYGSGLPVAGEFSSSLSNSGEQLVLTSDLAGTILDFEYNDSGDWPGRADGKGASLELLNTAADYDDPDNYRSSHEYHGSPGVAGAGPQQAIVINEVLTYTASPRVDYIELHNTTEQPIDVGGWYLSNTSDDYRKFSIPAGTVIAAGGYRLFEEHDFNGSGTASDFSLEGTLAGEVWLMATDSQGELSRFIDDVSFPASVLHESFGRWPNASGDLLPMATLTPAAANVGPRVGPVVISEVMYHPAEPGNGSSTDHLEFVELFNPSDSVVDLSGWQLDGSDYLFPAGSSLPAGEVLLVVPFDPTDASLRSDFEATYSVAAGATMLGPFNGSLSNGGETLTLLRPGSQIDAYLLLDQVSYSDSAPWPTSPDGLGDALTRLHCAASGNAPNNWQAALPSPGTITCTAPARVVDRHTIYSGSLSTGIAPDKQPLLPGQTATFSNYTSYVHGITGVVIDIANLSQPTQLTAEHFLFRQGNTSKADSWSPAPAPTEITVDVGAGLGGTDRVTLHFANGALTNTYLQVIVLPGAVTGLADADLFYFGNVVADTGDSATETTVTAGDFAAVRGDPHNFLNPAALDNPHDLNRDRRVNATDLVLVRDHASVLASSLPLINTLPEAPSPLATGGNFAFKSEAIQLDDEPKQDSFVMPESVRSEASEPSLYKKRVSVDDLLECSP